VPSYVLNDFAKADQNWLDDVLRGIGDGAAHLAEEDTTNFLNAVALRAAPARPSTGTKGPNAKTAPATEPTTPEEDARTAMQKLMNKFR
jgi:PTH1 family peptidyl-tRNA hydrolase